MNYQDLMLQALSIGFQILTFRNFHHFRLKIAFYIIHIFRNAAAVLQKTGWKTKKQVITSML